MKIDMESWLNEIDYVYFILVMKQHKFTWLIIPHEIVRSIKFDRHVSHQSESLSHWLKIILFVLQMLCAWCTCTHVHRQVHVHVHDIYTGLLLKYSTKNVQFQCKDVFNFNQQIVRCK